MASLKVIEGPNKGTEIALSDRATLGRSRQSDLQVKDPESSRDHAQVLCVDDVYYVKDLGSSNGTFVNETRVTEQALAAGDRIRIGGVVIEFTLSQPGTGDETPAIVEPDQATPADVTPHAAEPTEPPLDTELPGYKLTKKVRHDELTTTYLATELELMRPVAVELIEPDYCADPEAALDRVRLASRLEHPATAHLYAAAREGDTVYLAREPATGRSMWELCGKIPPLQVAEIGTQVAGAMAEAHALSMVHGSIRPDRIVRTAAGHLKLLGLGLPIPKVGTLSNQPDLQKRPSRIAYLAPEHLAGGHASQAGDVYALGAVLYHLAAGRAPFVAISESDLAPKIASGDVTPLTQLRPDTPKPIARAIEQMIARYPADRPGSMEDVEKQLQAALEKSRPARAADVVPIRSQPRIGEARGVSAGAIIIVLLSLLLVGMAALLGKTWGVRFIRYSLPTPSTPPARAAQTSPPALNGAAKSPTTPPARRPLN